MTLRNYLREMNDYKLIILLSPIGLGIALITTFGLMSIRDWLGGL